jgi:hypothetical protein
MRTMARASAQVSLNSHSRPPRWGAEVAEETGGAVFRNRLPSSSMTAVAAGGLETAAMATGRASGGRSPTGVGAGKDGTCAGTARRSWRSATSSSNRRTRSSKEGGWLSSLVVSEDSRNGGGISSADNRGGGPPSSARRARADSSSPLTNGTNAGIGDAESVAGVGALGAGSFVDSLGGTAIFLRAARSLLLFDIFTLAYTPHPWEINPNTSSIPTQRFLCQSAGRTEPLPFAQKVGHHRSF